MYVVELVGTTIAPKPVWPENHYKPWTSQLDKELLYLYMSGGWTPENLGKKFGRTTWAIVCRLTDRFKIDAERNRTYRDW